MVAGIESQNTASIRLHHSLGYRHRANAGRRKIGRWLDLYVYAAPA